MMKSKFARLALLVAGTTFALGSCASGGLGGIGLLPLLGAGLVAALVTQQGA